MIMNVNGNLLIPHQFFCQFSKQPWLSEGKKIQYQDESEKGKNIK
jgi:hypothetical protein